MLKTPLLSIYIPVYNHEKIIENNLSFIASELRKNQLTNEVEIVISDNASTDDTKAKVENFLANNSDLNLIYSRNAENIGGIKNIMHLWEKTTGDYVIMIGDDCFAPAALLNIVNSIKENKDADIIVLKNNAYNDFEFNPKATNIDVLKHVQKLEYVGNFVLSRSHFGNNFSYFEKYCNNGYPHLIMIMEKLASAKKVIDTRFTAINIIISWNYDVTIKVIYKLSIDSFLIVKMMRDFIGEDCYKFLIKHYNKHLYKNLRFIRGYKDRFSLCKYVWQEIPVKSPKVIISLFLHSLPAPFFYLIEVINSVFKNIKRCFKEIITNRKKWKSEKFKKFQDHVSDKFGIM